MVQDTDGYPHSELAVEVLALREELARMRTASKFAEYVTLKELEDLFRVGHDTMRRYKVAGLKPVNSGTKTEIFRVADVKKLWDGEAEVSAPVRRRKRKPK